MIPGDDPEQLIPTRYKHAGEACYIICEKCKAKVKGTYKSVEDNFQKHIEYCDRLK